MRVEWLGSASDWDDLFYISWFYWCCYDFGFKSKSLPLLSLIHQYRKVTARHSESHQYSGLKHFFYLQYLIYVGKWARQYSWFKSPRLEKSEFVVAGPFAQQPDNWTQRPYQSAFRILKRFSQISLVQCFINSEDCKVRITWGNKKQWTLEL